MLFGQNKKAMACEFSDTNGSDGAIRHVRETCPLFISAVISLMQTLVCLTRRFTPVFLLPGKTRLKRLQNPTCIFLAQTPVA